MSISALQALSLRGYRNQGRRASRLPLAVIFRAVGARRSFFPGSRGALSLFLLLPVMTGFSQQTPRAQESSPVTFTDVTTQSRIVFRHAASPTSQKYLLETMGGGVALFDYDNDGRLDLYFTNGAALSD